MEIKEEGTRHILILFNCKINMAGSVDFTAANAKSSAQLRVKGDRSDTVLQQAPVTAGLVMQLSAETRLRVGSAGFSSGRSVFSSVIPHVF